MIASQRLQDINPDKFEVIVYTSGLKGYQQEERSGNIHIYRSPHIGDGKISRRLTTILFWFWSLVKLLFENDVSFIHFDENQGISIPLVPGFAHKSGWTHFRLLAGIAQKRNIKTLFEHAISDEQGHFVPSKWEKNFYDRINYMVCISDALYEAVCQVYPHKAIKIINGIQDELFVPLSSDEKEQFRRDQGIDNKAIVFCFVGLVVRRKGFDLISTVFPEIVKEFPNSMFWCIGPRNHTESRHIHDDEVEIYLNSLGPVRNQVKFWGRIDNRKYLAKIMGASDIFLFPTRREGFGLVPAEAMACGIPPIIARIPGVTDLASIEGETGLYITPGNAEELRQAMRKLAANNDMRQLMGANARERIVNGFSWDHHVIQWEQLYNTED